MKDKIIKLYKRNKYEIVSAVSILIVFAVGVVFGALVLG
jgi:hypothetical protein